MRKYSGGIITNGWADTRVFCENGHEHPVEMVIGLDKNVLYYSCPECKNRISTNEFEKMLERIQKELVEAEMSDTQLVLTNYSWKEYSGIGKGNTYKVLRHDGAKIDISVLNPVAINRRDN